MYKCNTFLLTKKGSSDKILYPRQKENFWKVIVLRSIVVGGGSVGFDVAKNLVELGHDVIVIEQDEARAARIDEMLDVMVITGNGARPQVLAKAGVQEGEGEAINLLIACTDRDEVNILSCWIAKKAGVKHVISRARSLEFTDSHIWADALGIDEMISPERSVAGAIEDMLSIRSVIVANELWGGIASLYAMKVNKGSLMEGRSLKEVRKSRSDVDALIVYVEREDEKGFIPRGDTVLREGDLCYVVTLRNDAHLLESLFSIESAFKLKRIMIAGGGKIGFQVARRFEKNHKDVDIRLLDLDPQKCERISKELDKTLVLQGDVADEDVLLSEGIEETDGFVSTTANDELNILVAIMAKELGAKKSIAIVRNDTYRKLEGRLSLDAMVNPNEALVAAIMRYVTLRTKGAAMSTIEQINAEMIDLVVPEGAFVVGKKIMDLHISPTAIVVLVQRGEDIFVPDGMTTLKPNDRVLLYTNAPSYDEILNLFIEEK
ncbi:MULTISPECIES: Trk system potassium transporter TrkA [Acetomicrobium]|jgi:trk system potassium uptake protein TrkA|uniref:Trk system potassium transporter TrkA n=1 Tax=Acetomicrobium TaxID=49894 RepID=UPI0026EDDD36|nr:MULTISPECIES: Trk system potassium transporter TrkA [Acetomicrobium]MDI9377046.1 Trk system potassium transporter TrkA [Synergistota bacterium]MDR9770522.1 Trk system potassium transporter TrkA [Acetomicrobium sp.]HOB11228.1 Trk system potassium transporter TrkA [Acetomicrobium sp.]HPT65502.1 Trk system potassium transporter TrkA [Acetomicrobium sp.]HQA36868.1 Trk system potassium transporter TrkA [Acetomicrobium sp.]